MKKVAFFCHKYNTTTAMHVYFRIAQFAKGYNSLIMIVTSEHFEKPTANLTFRFRKCRTIVSHNELYKKIRLINTTHIPIKIIHN